MNHPIMIGRLDVAKQIPAPYTYEVVTGERYLHGLEDGEIRYWPERHVFMLDERTGQVMVTGGYGTYAHVWSPQSRKESLHAFLYRIRFDSFMAKAMGPEYMEADVEGTIGEMKRELLQERQSGTISAKEARNIWDLIEEDLSSGMGEQEFYDAIYRDSDLSAKYADGDPIYMRQRVNAGAAAFWEEVWSVFRRQVLAPWVQREAAEQEIAA